MGQVEIPVVRVQVCKFMGLANTHTPILYSPTHGLGRLMLQRQQSTTVPLRSMVASATVTCLLEERKMPCPNCQHTSGIWQQVRGGARLWTRCTRFEQGHCQFLAGPWANVEFGPRACCEVQVGMIRQIIDYYLPGGWCNLFTLEMSIRLIELGQSEMVSDAMLAASFTMALEAVFTICDLQHCCCEGLVPI